METVIRVSHFLIDMVCSASLSHVTESDGQIKSILAALAYVFNLTKPRPAPRLQYCRSIYAQNSSIIISE